MSFVVTLDISNQSTMDKDKHYGLFVREYIEPYFLTNICQEIYKENLTIDSLNTFH
mgnify:CR=1 FL=1